MEDHVLCSTQETAEPYGAAPPEAVGLLELIENENRECEFLAGAGGTGSGSGTTKHQEFADSAPRLRGLPDTTGYAGGALSFIPGGTSHTSRVRDRMLPASHPPQPIDTLRSATDLYAEGGTRVNAIRAFDHDTIRAIRGNQNGRNAVGVLGTASERPGPLRDPVG